MKDLQNILEKCLANDSKSQKLLYEKYYGFALKTVFRYVYRYEKAVDVVNDGFVKIFRNCKKFECAENDHIEKIWMGWVKRIMINTAIDALRKNNMMSEIGALTEADMQKVDRSNGADQKILYNELICQIKKLSPSYRIAFNLYVIDGYSHAEIAKYLNISVGTSKSNLSKARLQLQKYITKDVQVSGICNL